jgi:hypothetical protein
MSIVGHVYDSANYFKYDFYSNQIRIRFFFRYQLKPSVKTFQEKLSSNVFVEHLWQQIIHGFVHEIVRVEGTLMLLE